MEFPSNVDAMIQALTQRHALHREASEIKCPQCMKRHKKRGGPEQRCSHGALEIFVEAPCPICYEDSMGPPMIALACGHTMCPEDFKKLGGIISVVSDSSSESEDEEDLRQDFLETIMNAGIIPDTRDRPSFLDHPSPANDNDFLAAMRGRRQENQATDEASGSSMPALEVGSANAPSSDEDDSDDSDIPELVGREDNSSSDDDSDDSSANVPQVRSRRGGAPRRPEVVQVQDGSDHSSLPDVIPRDRASSSDESEMPGLDIPDLEDGGIDDGDDDSALRGDSMPPLRPIEHTSNRHVLELPATTNGYTDSLSQEGPVVSNSDELMSGADLGGILMLTPAESEGRKTLYRITPTDVRQVTETTFPGSSKIVAPTMGQIFVFCPGQRRAVVKEINGRGDVHDFLRVDNSASIVSDGQGVLWALSSGSGGRKVLDCFVGDSQTRMPRTFSNQSFLIPRVTGGCWVHVKDGNDLGFWKCTVSSQEIFLQMRHNAKVTHDMNGGLWIFTSQGVLYHMTNDGVAEQLSHNLEYTKDTKLIPLSHEKVYIHSRYNGSWKVSQFQKHGPIVSLGDCPKDSKVTSDNVGNVYMMIKERRQPRKLVVFERTDEGRNWTQRTHQSEPAPGSIIGGL